MRLIYKAMFAVAAVFLAVILPVLAVRAMQPPDSAVKVHVIPANEELVLAREVFRKLTSN